MARRNVALKIIPVSLSPQRQALAEAIAEHRARTEQIAALESAVEQVHHAWVASSKRKEKAEAALREAKDQAADNAVAAVLGKKPAGVTTTKAARAAIEEATDDIEEATLADETLRARLQEAKTFLPLSEDKLQNAAAAVLRESPEVARLTAAVTELQRKLADAGAALLFLDRIRALADRSVSVSGHDAPVRTDGLPQEIVLAVQRLMAPPSTWNKLSAEVPGARPWHQALTALMTDASAPLPG